MASEELKRWTIDIRKGHAADKKVRTDRNRIADFLDFAGDRPVNKYRYSDFQSFANLLARVPANYMKEPATRDMTRQECLHSLGLYGDRKKRGDINSQSLLPFGKPAKGTTKECLPAIDDRRAVIYQNLLGWPR